MTKHEKLRRCLGCRNDFYNGKNEYGVKECWSLQSMKLVRKRPVHVDERPPWVAKVQWVPNCYHRERYVYVNPEVSR